jgi:Tol biopolymer transport system component
LLSPDARLYADPAVSPDGSKIAVDVKRGPGVNEIWVFDLVRRTWLRLTTGQNDWTPAWQDDHTLVFVRGRDNAAAIWDVYALTVTGNATPTLLASSFSRQVGNDAVAPDHSAIVFGAVSSSSSDLWTQPLRRDGKAPGRQAAPLVATPANEMVIPCGFSPDARRLAYMSDATGRWEIYVTDFPAGSTHYPVSSAGGAAPCWSKDGRQIFYWYGDTAMAVAVRSGETFAADTPHALFDSPVAAVNGYDVARDGRTFYVPGYEVDRTSPIVFVSDITADLRSGANAH